jgi:hypothetical protein
MQWVVSKTSCDGIGNVMKGFLSALSVNPNTTVECNPEYMYGLYDSVLDSKHIYRGGGYEPFYTCRLLVLKSEEPYQENIANEFQHTSGCGNPALNHHYSTTRLIDWNYDPKKVHARVRTRILAAIQQVVFRPEILRWVNGWTSHFVGPSLGISVRTWKAQHEHNIDRPYNADTYKQAIDALLPRVSTVVLSVDTDAVIEEYMQHLSTFSGTVIVLRKSEEQNPIQFAFVKALALSKCTYLVANRISTFTELVYWWSGCSIQVTPVF